MSRVPQPVFFALHGVHASLETDHGPFAAFARRQLMDLIPAENPHLQVVARLHWNKKPPNDWKNLLVRQWGRRLYQADGRLLQAEVLPFPGLQLAATWVDSTLHLDGYYSPSSRREKLAAWLGKGREMTFNALLYYLVYFPLIFILEQTRGWHLLHAGGVSRPDGGWVLAGLPGSGKSTLTLSLLDLPETNFISDNLLLHDHQQVYAVPESIHLSAESTSLLPGAIRERLADKGLNLSHHRSSLSLSFEGCIRQEVPQAFFFLGLGNQLEISPLAQATALERLLAFNQVAREVIAYTQFAAPLVLITPGAVSPSDQRAALASLLSQTRCYEIWLERGAPLALVGNELAALVSSHQPDASRFYASPDFLAERSAPA